ncbi:LOW QUALITY PROTEIN: leucine-rich repeat-containing protein 37A-like [Camelus ferus]|uniref:LOW QUALITY PROTEIN: leucine-rich repeat-containing protein 37A-like n=1 Tax=Camelus ferus TaxID=419612 RepID=A0A8B8R6V1_CAMFR|nr:LOW QUALITY PROTEIN: leucine-rich repeat-containing protein 37A-like [Camelus ferus]
MMWRPRKLVGSSFNTKPSLINEDKAAVSSSLPPAPTPPKSEVKQESKDLSYTILEDAEGIVRNMEASKPTSRPRKKHLFLGPRSRAMHRAFQAKRNRNLKRKELLRRISAGRPPSSAVRSLINSPSQEAISSSGELNSHENPPELFSSLDPLAGKATVPEGAISEVAAHTDVPSTYSVTTGNFMPTVEHTGETQLEYHSVDTELPSKPTSFTSPGPSSLGDQFEIQVNQQLRSIIPNDYMRGLISHLIRTLKMDCSETHVKLSCAKFFTRTGLLIKLLSEQQKVKLSQAEGDTDLWKTENYISESTEGRSDQTGQEPHELTEEVPGYGYSNELILAISVSVTAAVAVLIIGFCLFEIYSHRTAAKGDRKSVRGFFRFVLHRKCPEETENQEGFWRMRPFWLRDVYKPLSATRKKNMMQKLHDGESSDEEEIFSRDARAPRDGAADVVLTIESEEPDEESETAQGSDAMSLRVRPEAWRCAAGQALEPGSRKWLRGAAAGLGWPWAPGPQRGPRRRRRRRRLLPPVPGPEKGAKEASEERAQRMPPGRATPGPQLTWACSAPDCPGLTQGMVQLLRSHGIKTVVDFVSADLEVVAQKCGLSYKALVALRRVLLAQFSAFPFSGADLYEELKTYTAILSTGIESLDKLLDAGLYTGEVTEIVGGPGSGKTQVHVRPAAGGLVEVCLCVSAHVACGLQQNVLYIDSNGGFTASCILQLLQARTPDEEEQAGALQRIQVVRAFDIFQLLDVLQDLGGTVAQQLG